MSTKRTNKKMLAARVLCTLLLGTFFVGGYGEKVAWGASAESTQIFEDGAHGDKSKVASAWGSNTTANNTASTAFGANTNASGEYSTAFGNGTVASGSIATAWGNSAKAYGSYSTAFGKGTAGDKGDNNKGELATAWGDSTVASGDTATVWGYHAKASGDFSTAFGSYTKASGMNSTAFGSYTKASGMNSTAFGDTTEARGENATAWGIKAKAYGVNSTSFGANTVAGGHGATAFGGSSMALGFCSTAWGYATQAGQLLYGLDKKVAYIVDYIEGGTTKYKIVDYNSEEKTTLKDGFNSYWDAYSECEVKEADQATAWGSGAKATDWHATAFGFETIASGKRATAFGQKSEASGESATAWGGYFDGNVYKGGTASGTASTAFGVETEASGFASTAFGVETKSKGKATTAFGVGSIANTEGSTAWGYYSVAGSESINDTDYSGEYATAFGKNSYALGNYSTAIGYNSMTTAENSLAAIGGKIIEKDATNSAAIGMDAWVTVKETVALGSKSVASRDNVTDTTKYTGYNPLTGKSGTENTDNSGAAWVATRNAIAVGDADNGITRQITGVAAGTDDTDAVNVAQLKAMAAASVYTAADGITVDTDKKISIKANTEDFKFESGTLNLTKNGKVESGNTGVVTGGTVYDAMVTVNENILTLLYDGLDTKAEKDASNVGIYGGPGNSTKWGTALGSGTITENNGELVKGGTVFAETRVAADGNYIKASNSAADNLGALDTQVKANADAIGTTADGTYVKSSDSVGENLNTLDTELAALAGGTGAGLSEVNHRIDNLDSKTNKVGAGAAALAALHPMDTDGKFGLALGYGNYRSANAMAMGLFYRPTDRVMFSIGGSMGNGENLMNVGVSFALDKGVTTSKAAMARKINALEEQNSAILEENKAIRAENAKLAERLAAIEAKLGK